VRVRVQEREDRVDRGLLHPEAVLDAEEPYPSGRGRLARAQ
jgi:hypothetical protein